MTADRGGYAAWWKMRQGEAWVQVGTAPTAKEVDRLLMARIRAAGRVPLASAVLPAGRHPAQGGVPEG
jgi:hypothetical protein